MKISVNWILDHILTPIKTLDVGLIAARFNLRTAEIEHYEKNELDINNLFLARITSIDKTECTTFCDELNRTVTLSYRNDVQIGQLLLIRQEESQFSWEALKHYSSTKEGLFPAVDCQENLVSGGWKQNCEDFDYILDVDNKSINHRPDLWGHRGIAREVAAFMEWELRPIEEMLVNIPIVNDPVESKTENHSLNLEIKDLDICSRIATLSCHQITHKASQIWMAMRLARVDSKPINSIVDMTNYVMFDTSQPMHVFDAKSFSGGTLQVRRGAENEKLELLDGHQINLSDQDIVITDGKTPLALSGVMGGKWASFTQSTSSIIIESASFNASMIRNSATRAKVTTEAATRFSKQLDPMQNTTAILRFMYLAHQSGIISSINESILSVGAIIKESTIVVRHSFIETRLGIKISSKKIISILESLQFHLSSEQDGLDIIYKVLVPTNRMTKDIQIPEDIVEEVARIYGFENITYHRPYRAMESFDISPVTTLRKIKQHCAFAMNMREIRDYLFYDESFLRRLAWYPTDAVAIKNPVSENWKVLVTSLIPHLIKNVELNMHNHEQMNFFEHNSVWKEILSQESLEHKSLAGLFFGSSEKDFYDYKDELQHLFASLGLPVLWTKCSGPVEPWFDQLQAADLTLDGVVIGRAGILSSTFIRPVAKGKGFIFEINTQLMLAYQTAKKQFKMWSKYQSVKVDVSILIDTCQAADNIKNLISASDNLIDQVEMVDFFEKESWGNKRSLTFRYTICDYHQNLSKEVIDMVTDKVNQTIINLGAEIR